MQIQKIIDAERALEQLNELCKLGASVDPTGPVKAIRDLINFAANASVHSTYVPDAILDEIIGDFHPSEKMTRARLEAVLALADHVGRKINRSILHDDDHSEPQPTALHGTDRDRWEEMASRSGRHISPSRLISDGFIPWMGGDNPFAGRALPEGKYLYLIDRAGRAVDTDNPAAINWAPSDGNNVQEIIAYKVMPKFNS